MSKKRRKKVWNYGFATIFNFNVTDDEIKELFSKYSGCQTVAEYKKWCDRGLYSDFGGDFMAYVELEELFKFRGNAEKAEHFGQLAHKTEYWRLKMEHLRRV